jgi:UDP-glucose:(heptosyl)LPS alpha-1,3-glucosyltransferase
MAQGLPVIVSAAPHCGLSSELTHLQDAWLLANPTDHHQLAHAIEQILSHPEMNERLVQGGLKQARQRTWAFAAEKYEKIMGS